MGPAKSRKSAGRRDASGRFPPGVSGNPQGRVKGSQNRSTAQFRKVLRETVSWDELVQQLQVLALEGNVPAARLLFSYAYGAVRSADEIEDREEHIRLTPEQVRALPDEALERIRDGEAPELVMRDMRGRRLVR